MLSSDGVTLDVFELVIGFTELLNNSWLHFTNHYHTQTNVRSYIFIADSHELFSVVILVLRYCS
jgi:hypothetical protein